MRVFYYQARDGTRPVEDSMEELARERPEEHDAVLLKQRIVRELSFEESVQAGHVKPVRGKIWELKMKGHQSRILGFRYEQDFVAATLVIKKQSELDDRDIRVARERRGDWNERYGT